MASLNKMCILGKLGKDIELKQGQNGGQSYADLSVATDDYAGKKDGKAVFETTWHNCRVFGQQAEYAAANAKKGSSVYVEGPLTKQISGEKVYINIKVNVFILSDRGNTGNQASGAAAESAADNTSAPTEQAHTAKPAAAATRPPAAQRQAAEPVATASIDDDDDLPF